MGDLTRKTAMSDLRKVAELADSDQRPEIRRAARAVLKANGTSVRTLRKKSAHDNPTERAVLDRGKTPQQLAAVEIIKSAPAGVLSKAMISDVAKFVAAEVTKVLKPHVAVLNKRLEAVTANIAAAADSADVDARFAALESAYDRGDFAWHTKSYSADRDTNVAKYQIFSGPNRADLEKMAAEHPDAEVRAGARELLAELGKAAR